MQIPAIQTFITGKVTTQLSQQLDTRVEISSVDIDFFKKVVVEGVYLEDQQQDTLLYADRLRVDIGIFALFSKTIVLDEILLENAYVNLYAIDDSATLNFAFIPEAFADTTQQDTTQAGWEFDIHDIILSKLRFNFNDYTTAMELSLAVDNFEVALETLGLEESHIQANAIEIDGLDFKFNQIAAQTEPSDTLATSNPDTTGTDDPLNPSGFVFSVNEFVVERSAVLFATDTASSPGKINFNNLDLEQLFIRINDIQIGENSISADVQNISLTETNSNFQLKELAIQLGLEMPSVKAKLTNFETNNSALNGQITVSLPNINQPDSLMNNLFVNAGLDSTRIGLKDATLFSPGLDSIAAFEGMTLKLAGSIKVDSGNALVKDFELETGENAYLLADAEVLGMNDIEQAYLDVNVRSFVSNFDFIASFLPPDALPPSLRKAGDITFKARAEGYLNDADLVANLTSEIGRVNANVNYRAREGGNFAIAGEANAYRIDLQAITGNDSIGFLTANTNFAADMQNGSFSADTLMVNLKSLQFNDYNYEDLRLRASFKDSLLLSNIVYEDEYLNFDINAKAKLKEANSWLALDGNIEEVDLLQLKLSPDSIMIQTQLAADVENLDLDLLNGYFRLSNTTFIDGARKYELDTFQISAETNDTIRYIRMDSDFLDAELKGRFAFSRLPQMISNFTTHYFTSAVDTAGLPEDQYFELNIAIAEEPILVRAFMPDLNLPHPSTVYAAYEADDHNLEVEVDIPEVHYMDYRINYLQLDADTEHEDNIKFQISANQIAVGEGLTIPDFGIEGSFIQDMMQVNVHIANSESPSYLDLNAFLTNNQDTIIFEILESSLAMEGEEWNIPDSAFIKYADQFLSVKNFELTQEEQNIQLYSEDELSENPVLNLDINAFEVGDVLTVLDMEDYEIEGKLKGTARIVDVFTLKQVNADFGIDNLIVNAQEAGDLNIQAEKRASEDAISTNVGMKGEHNDFSLTGTYNPEDSINTFDMKLAIAQFRLEQWGVLAEEFVTDLEGNIQANMDLTGSISKPVVEGYFAFDPESQMRIKAIGALYQFEKERIVFSETAINLNNFIIVDSANHKLTVAGEITHDYFQDFVFDLSVTTPEFKFFNAKERNSPEFFGTVNASTDISITGPMDNLSIEGDVGTKRGTALVVALLDDPDVASHAGFVNFVNTNAYMGADSIPDSTQSVKKSVELTGISLNLMLNITQQAQVEILIDPVSRDKLVAVGSGDIRVQMSPTGDMSIQGTYILQRGSYSLSFMNVLKREFAIREGSTINLAGDPLGASFDITAVYQTEANAGDLYSEQQGMGMDQYDVEQPVNVVLSVEGTLESPDISFDIETPEINDPYNPIAQRISMIKENQTQLYQQVFGLIVLNRFIPTDGGLGGGGGGGAAAVNQRVDASVSSILTTQLSRLTEDYLGGVELSVDLESRDQGEASFENKDVQVQLSKQLLNERLTVTVGGTSSLGNQPNTPGGNNSGLMGDFEVLYRINESGTLNLRIFQSNSRDIFTQEIRQRQGTSVTYVKSFDEIFISEDNKKVLRAE